VRYLPLAPEQRQSFEDNGYLIIPNALDAAMVERLTSAVDRLYEDGLRAQGHNTRGYWEMRNCIGQDPAFLELLDWPATVPLVPQLLNWNIQLNTSHIIVRPPSPPETQQTYRQTGWHRDGGTSPKEM
jgi:ectoine hydroxylase